MSAQPPDAPIPTDVLREPGMRGDAEEAFRAAIMAVEPSRLVVRAFGALPSAVKSALQMRQGRVVVIGAGKAAAAMASGLEDLLADIKVAPGVTPPPPVEGLVVLKHGTPRPRLRRIQVREAAHPVPDAAGEAAARDMIALLRGLSPQDLAFAVFSGGASALLPAPPDGISLDDLRATTDLLLGSGATIHEMNAIRKHLSTLAGGQLAAANRGAALIAYVISDVTGDRLDSIASGPTVPDESTFREAFAALRKHELLEKVPAPVRQRLELGARGKIPETPKAGDKAFAKTRTVIIGSNRTALDAAGETVRERGYSPVIVPGGLQGDARAAGELLAKRMVQLKEKGKRALIVGGETTVKVKGGGRGGRNQEVALGAALALAGQTKMSVLAAGTDGEDGPTDAAGAMVDGATVAQAKELGLDVAAALKNNDAYPLLERLGLLVKTGPTGTNVMDVAIGLIG